MSRRAAAAAPTRAWVAPLLAAAALAACRGSDPQPFLPLALDRFAGASSLLAGGGSSSTFGYTSGPGLDYPTLRLVRQDPAELDALAPLGDVTFAPGAQLARLHVTEEAAVLVVDQGVQVVDLTGPWLAPEVLSLDRPALDAIAAGRWVAVAVDHGLTLVNRDDPATSYQQPTASTPAALLATRSGFLAFTATGYLTADTTGATPAFAEQRHPVLHDLREALALGDAALAAGPADDPDRTRVLRLDLTDPAAPAVVRSHEVPGGLVAFAWDGAATSLVAVHGPGDDADPVSFHEGYLLLESPAGFQARGVPLQFWSRGRQVLAAHAERLLAVQAAGVAALRIQ